MGPQSGTMVPSHAMMTLMTTPGGTSAATSAADAGASPTAPLRIHADRAAGTLAIEWADGHHTLYEAQPLRWLCPCAFCRGEAGMPGWLDSGPTLTAEQIKDMKLPPPVEMTTEGEAVKK